MSALYKRELKSYFRGLTGCLFCAVYLIWSGIFMLIYNLKSAIAQPEATMYYNLLLLLLIIPILTMRTFAEERRQKTDQLLLSLPLTTGKIVMAKYLSAMTVIALPIVFTGVYPLILSLFGTVNLASAYAALFAELLFAALIAAIGVFISALCENPAIAAILSIVVNAALFFLTQLVGSDLSTSEWTSLIAVAVLIVLAALLVYFLTKSFGAAYVFGAVGAIAAVVIFLIKRELYAGAVNAWINAISPIDRMTPFMSGIFDLTAVVYYVAGSALFLFFSLQAVEKRRWN